MGVFFPNTCKMHSIQGDKYRYKKAATWKVRKKNRIRHRPPDSTTDDLARDEI